jgi:hypothetical protein
MILEDGMIQAISTNGRFIPGVQAMFNGSHRIVDKIVHGGTRLQNN